MKRRQKHIIMTFCACLLALCSICSTVFAAGAADPFDYGRTGMASNETLDALTVFERLFGEPTTEAERVYLDELSALTLTYNSAIPDSQIVTSYDKENAVLDVTLQAYTFTAANGATVVWIPQSARFEDLTETFVRNGDTYSCRFEHLEEYVTGDFEMKVDFCWTVELPADAAEKLLNDAYRTGYTALHGQILPYEAEYAEYNKELNAYLAWQAYLDAVAEYEDYQVANDAYQTALDAYRTYISVYDNYITDYYQEDQQSVAVRNAYNAYINAYNIYLERIAACEKPDNADEANAAFVPVSGKYAAVISTIEAWDAWEKYQDFRTNHLEAYNDYLIYCAQIEKVTSKLSVLESLFVADSNDWQLYRSLLGNTVAAVVEGKGELIAAGCNEEDINAAGDSTVILREVMKGYADLRKAKYESEHARTAALYSYYVQHYTTLKTQFDILCTSLNSLYGNSLVVAKLSAEGKLEHYRQFVGQLYITSTCLDDSKKMSESWTLNNSKLTIKDIVEPIHIIPDGIADPNATDANGKLLVVMPEAEVPYVEFVEEVAQPTVDRPKDTPTAPVAATGLIKPTPLTDPSLGTVPPEADEPRSEPTAPVIDSRVRALAEEVRAGHLAERDIADYSRTLTLNKTVTRLVSIDNRKTVTFLSHDGTTVLDQQVVEYGTTVRYRGEEPSIENDAQYSYVFLDWVLADGTHADMVAVSDLTLYANYAKSLRHYSITWVLDGVTRKVENLPYGDDPLASCPFVVNKPTDERYEYSFSGWSPEVAAVTGDATYTGSITATPRVFTVTWDLGDRTETAQFSYGEYAAYEGTPTRSPDDYLYTFRSWNKSLDRVTGDVTYTALYDALPLAKATDGSVMEIQHGEETLTLLCERNRLDIRNAADYALANGKSLTLQWADFSLTMDRAGLESFCASPAQIRLFDPYEDAYGRVYTLGYCNNVGESIALDVPVTLVANADADGNARDLFLLQNNAWTALGAEAADLRGGATVRVTDRYWIDVKRVEHCFLSHIPSNAGAGTVIDLKVNCEFGYEVSAARVTLEDGTVVPVDNLTFLMPCGNVSVELTVTKIVYHVSFVSDGVVISQADYFLGDRIVIPSAPTKASDGVYDYVFSGWSQDVTIAFGDDRNPVIEAVWSATPVLTHDPYQSGNNNNVLITVVLPIVGVVVLIGVATFLTLRYLKKRKGATAVEVFAANEEFSSTLEQSEDEEDTPQSAQTEDEGDTLQSAQTEDEHDLNEEEI